VGVDTIVVPCHVPVGWSCDVVDGEHVRAIAARVRGPTLPQPLVRGEPEQIFIFLHCHCCTADCVRRPK
jgi:hypothetical protein